MTYTDNGLSLDAGTASETLKETRITSSYVDLGDVARGIDVGAGEEVEALVFPETAATAASVNTTVDFQVVSTLLDLRASTSVQVDNNDWANSGDVVTIAEGHSFLTGEAILLEDVASFAGATNHALNTTYYAIRLTATTFTVATTMELALAGTKFVIDSDSTGVGKFTSVPTGEVALITALDNSAETITVAGHGLSHGTAVRIQKGGGTLGGVTTNITYYIHNVSTDTFSLALTSALADAGTKVNITGSISDSNGVLTLYVPPTIVGSSGPITVGYLGTSTQVTFPLGQRFLTATNDRATGQRLHARYVTSATTTAGKFSVNLVTSYHGGRGSYYPTGSTIL